MPGEVGQAPGFQFFVYVVESPSAPDIYHGRSEGGLVASAVALDGIPAVTRTVINREAFVAALQLGLPEAMKLYPTRLPVLHLSAHGGADGIQLSSGDVINWAQLRGLLVPINQGLGGFLLLCMSACEGYGACRMAMQTTDEPHPYLAMVGNHGSPTWADTAVAYASFYHLLARGYPVPDAVLRMRRACGNDRWELETAEDLKQSYLAYLEGIHPGQVREELQAAADEALPSPEAKALEAGS